VRLPPAWVRRPVAVVGLLAVLALAVVLAPVLLVVAAVRDIVSAGRWRAVRLLGFLLVYLLLELGALLAALALWVASGLGWRLDSPRFRRAHYAVLRRVLHALVAAAQRLFRLRVTTVGPSWSPLDDGVPGSTNAMLVLSRHAGPGDSVLLVETLMNRDHLRRPRIVLKAVLQLDPMVDVYLNRLPNRFLVPGRADLAEEVGALARGLGEEDAFLIFPEGGNFTQGRRRRVIEALRGGGRHTEAGRAERMVHVLPPRTGGVLAALAAAPTADVVFVAHTGLEHLSTLRDIWRGLPMEGEVLMRWWFVPADEVPRSRHLQSEWLYERWSEIDRWIGEHRPDPVPRRAGTEAEAS
jgi:1-acyl-sn-glycerol-3-phosphate acyltransferase